MAFSCFCPLECDYGNVFIPSIRVAKHMRGTWALNWARRKEANHALGAVNGTGNLFPTSCLQLSVFIRTRMVHPGSLPLSSSTHTALANIWDMKEPRSSQQHKWWGWWQGQCHHINSLMGKDGRMVRGRGRRKTLLSPWTTSFRVYSAWCSQVSGSCPAFLCSTSLKNSWEKGSLFMPVLHASCVW